MEKELGYLAGIIDGEGSLFISNTKKGFAPAFDLTNTNKKIMYACKDILEKIDIRVNISFEKRKHINPKTLIQYKPRYRIKLCRKKDLVKLCSILQKYLIGKKERAKFLKNFILEKDELEKIKIYEKIKQLNQRGSHIWKNPDLAFTLSKKR